MKKSAIKALVACAALGAFSASFAQNTGWSVGGSIGGSHWKGNDLGGLATDPSDTGGKVYGGYSFTPNFSLEGGYADLGKYHGPLGDMRARGAFLDAVGTLPLADSPFSLLGRVGVFDGRVRESVAGVSDSDSGANVKFGAGVQYDLTRNLAVRTEWERYKLDALDAKDNVDMYSVGLHYRF